MSELPFISTPRLHLRPFSGDDAAVVQRLAGDRRVADTTATVPHPYPDGAAEAWIATHEPAWILGRGLTLAIELRAEDAAIGAIGLAITPETESAELGYWIGVPYWGRGYCTEAARALVEHGFSELRLARIHAHHFTRNVASGRVLEKVGMTPDRVRPGAFMKWGRLEDIRELTIERAGWLARCGA